MKHLLVEYAWTALVFSVIWAVVVFWLVLPEDEDGEAKADSSDS